MSQSRPPHGPARRGHPDEALAAFSDGTATPDDRATVLEHLQGCDTCRREIDLARRAIGALGSLAEPEAPGLDPAAIVRRAGNVVGLDSGPRAGRRWAGAGSRTFAAGIASGLVAAGIVAALAIGLVRLGGGGAATSASGGAGSHPAAAAPNPTYRSTDTNYTPATIDALAGTVARTVDTPQHGTAIGPAASSGSLAAKDATEARSCVDHQTKAGMQPLGAVLARFQGRPAFIEGFLVGSPGARSVRIVVADRDTCAVLYTTTRSVPAG